MGESGHPVLANLKFRHVPDVVTGLDYIHHNNPQTRMRTSRSFKQAHIEVLKPTQLHYAAIQRPAGHCGFVAGWKHHFIIEPLDCGPAYTGHHRRTRPGNAFLPDDSPGLAGIDRNQGPGELPHHKPGWPYRGKNGRPVTQPGV